MLDFKFSPYEEDIVITGAKGSGKTERGKKILSAINNIPYWVYDYSKRFNNYGTIVDEVEKLEYGQFVFRAKEESYKTWEAFCDRAFFHFKDIVLCHDELHQFVRKQTIDRALYQLVLSGRNRGISNIFITTRPASIPNYILTNCQHVFAYQLRNRSDIVWLKEYMGEEAELLLPPDKRKDSSPLKSDSRILKKFDYIYRNQDDEACQVIIN